MIDSFWNNVDAVNFWRYIVIGISVVCSILILIFTMRSGTLTKRNSETRDLINQVEIAHAKMQNDDHEGMYKLLELLKSPYHPVREEAQRLLDVGHEFYKKKRFFSEIGEPQWDTLAKVDTTRLDFYKKKFTGEKEIKTLYERAMHLYQVSYDFGLHFKIYEVDKIKEWFEQEKYVPIIEEAKRKQQK